MTAEAQSACHPSDPLPALFAGSQTCGDETFKLSGSGNTINGDIHSNDDIIFGGENEVNGQGTYVGTATTPYKIDWTPDAGSNSPRPTYSSLRSPTDCSSSPTTPSRTSCDDWGIDTSGSDNDWEGVIYAPTALGK